MKAFKALIKPFEEQQRRTTITIEVNFLSSSGIETRRVNKSMAIYSDKEAYSNQML